MKWPICKRLALSFVTLAAVAILCWISVTERGCDASESQWQGTINREANTRISEIILHLQNLGNRTSPANQLEAAKWITERFRSIAVSAEIENMEEEGIRSPVVVARRFGKNRADEYILLLAHLDSYADNIKGIAPGADDDASGVAVLLEVAREITKVDHERSILFCVFSNEERGRGGSRGFARRARMESMDIKAAINVDVVGYNRPFKPIYYDAVTSHATARHRAKAVWRMQGNYFRGLIAGRNVINVAGRPGDEELVNALASALRGTGELSVKTVIDPGCG